VGIATGEGTIVHAANSKLGITEVTTEQFIHGSEFRGVKRIIPRPADMVTLLIPQGTDIEWDGDVKFKIMQNVKVAL